MGSPLFLAAGLSATAIVVMLGALLTRVTGLYPHEATFAYTTAGAFMLLYSVGSSAYTLVADRYLYHAQLAFMYFLAVMLLLGIMAYLLSGIPLSEAQGYRTAFIILIIGEVVLLAIGIFMRSVILWLQREER